MKIWFKKLIYLLPFIGSYLGSLGGQGVKEWRRVILPIIFATIGIITLQTWIGMILGTFGIWVAMGYGVPDIGYPTDPNADSGSTLGRFFWNLTNKNHRLTDIFTRGTVGLGMCLSGLVIPILKSNWLPYLIGCACIIIGQTVFSYRGLGEVSVLGKNLLVSDLINYFLIFLGYTIMLAMI